MYLGCLFKKYFMKSKLLFVFLSISMFSFGQEPVPAYYGTDGATYSVLTTTTPIDQTTSGANMVWDFNQLTVVGSSADSNLTPTSIETATYPNTMAVSKNVSTVGSTIITSLIYYKTVDNVLSVTAARGTNLELNFSTDNANLGTFPANYGDPTNIDAVAGTYTYAPYSGTFTGTVTTSVDGYGTLNLDINGSGVVTSPATRSKSILNITLNNTPFTNVGNVVQTTYSYYNSSYGNAPIFRTNSNVITIPLLSINQNIIRMEKFDSFLGVNQNQEVSNTIRIYPNPVENVLNLQNKSSINIKTITITDMSGRTILKTNYYKNEINVSSLQKGIYLATIETERKTVTQKFIKK